MRTGLSPLVLLVSSIVHDLIRAPLTISSGLHSRVVLIDDEGWAERVEDKQEARKGLRDEPQDHEHVHPENV